MSPRDLLASSWRGLTSNVARSALTMLGILVGVAAVIVLVAVGNGSAKSVSDTISGLGTNTLTVTAGRSSSSTQTYSLTTKVADEIADTNLTPHVSAVSPTVTSSSITAAAGTESTTVNQVVGTTTSYFAAQDQTLGWGRSFTDDEVASGARVVVLGSTPADDLFGSARAALGQSLTLDGTSYSVVGVLQASSSNGIGDSSSTAIAPLSTVRASLAGYGDLSSIIVTAVDSDSVDQAEAEVEAVLNSTFKITDTTSLPYNVQNASSLLEAQESSSRTFTVLLGVVAGISLLVGGLGITNIMLVTVTERTREIGVRKALGAPRRSILAQFLIESSAMSLAGGVLGVLVGLAISRVTIFGVAPVVSMGSIYLSLGTCLLIGVFFGSVPANRAAGLRPVEALRHE